MNGNEGMIQRRGASQAATFIVAASDSLHPGRADYVCNGVDDQVTIQAAIDAAYAAKKGNIFQMAGTYHIDAPLTGKDYVDLLGSGFGTVWDVSSLNSGAAIVMGDRSTLSSLQIKGTISPLHAYLYQHIESGNYTTLSNIYMNNVATGINVNGKNDVKILNTGFENVKATSDYAPAIHVTGSAAAAVFISDVYISDCNRGIEIEDGATNIAAQHGNISNTPDMSVNVRAHGTSVTSKVAIRDFFIKDSAAIATWGDTLATVKNVVFDEITMKDSVDYVLFAGNSKYCKLINSVIESPTTALLTVAAASVGIEIKNNHITSPTSLQVRAYGDHAIIEDNYIESVVAVPTVWVTGDHVSILRNHLGGTSTWAGIIIDGEYARVIGNTLDDDGIEIEAGGLNTIVTENIILDGTAFDDAGTNTKIYRNIGGGARESSGTDTVTAATKAVTHGLGVTPAVGDIMITPVADISPAVRWWISGLTSSQFTINLDQAPTNPAAFAWRAIVL